MAKERGFVRCICDRCGRSGYVLESDGAGLEAWQEIERISATGRLVRTLCEECASSYKALQQAQDQAFNEYMKGAK